MRSRHTELVMEALCRLRVMFVAEERTKDKKSKAEKKQVAGQESVSGVGPAIAERKKDNVIQVMEEHCARTGRWWLACQKETTVKSNRGCTAGRLHSRSGLDWTRDAWTSGSVE